MKRLLICSVGTSLLSNISQQRLQVKRHGRIDEFDNRLFDSDAARVESWLQRLDRAGDVLVDHSSQRPTRNRILARLTQDQPPAWEDVPSEESLRWARRIGAELATLARLRREAANDKVVFLCSDSADSVFCASLAWHACSAWNWTTTGPITDDIRMLEGLKPEDPEAFKTAMEVSLQSAIDQFVHDARLGDEDHLGIVGSGGYKAAAAYYYKALAARTRPRIRSLVFLYEDTSRCIRYAIKGLGAGPNRPAGDVGPASESPGEDVLEVF
jgi:hypothetical protein